MPIVKETVKICVLSNNNNEIIGRTKSYGFFVPVNRIEFA